MGDDPPHAILIEGWALEESWGEISALYFLHLFVSFVLGQRSFATSGQFSLGGGSSPIFMDCKSI